MKIDFFSHNAINWNKFSYYTVLILPKLRLYLCLSLKKRNVFVHQKGKCVFPSKGKMCFSFKNGNVLVSQKGKCACPCNIKMSLCMSVKKGTFIYALCPYKKGNMFVSWKRKASFIPQKNILSFKKAQMLVPQ